MPISFKIVLLIIMSSNYPNLILLSVFYCTSLLMYPTCFLFGKGLETTSPFSFWPLVNTQFHIFMLLGDQVPKLCTILAQGPSLGPPKILEGPSRVIHYSFPQFVPRGVTIPHGNILPETTLCAFIDFITIATVLCFTVKS